MIKTVFVDVSEGKYIVFKEYSFNIPCISGEYVDFTDYNPHGDDDIFEVLNVIHLPNEAKKVVEIELTHSNNIKRPEHFEKKYYNPDYED